MSFRLAPRTLRDVAVTWGDDGERVLDGDGTAKGLKPRCTLRRAMCGRYGPWR